VTRFIIKVGVSYGSDMEKVKEVLLDCASKNPHVVTRDKLYRTTVRLADFSDSSVVFELLFYSDNMFRIESTKSDLRFAIWHAFKEHGIQIPFPQRDLHIRSAEGLQPKPKEE
jgi:small-conductance mechanosensitive channel